MASRSLSTLAPLPAPVGLHFCVVPLQLGSTDPHGALRKSIRLRGSTILKTLGSVKHEGAPTRKWQKGDICHALTTEAFASFCQRTMEQCALACLGSIAFSLHMVWKTVLFLLPFSFALCCILATFSSMFPVFFAWHCAFHAPAFRCHREIFAMLEVCTCGGSRVWNFFTSPSSLWHPRISVLFFIFVTWYRTALGDLC